MSYVRTNVRTNIFYLITLLNSVPSSHRKAGSNTRFCYFIILSIRNKTGLLPEVVDKTKYVFRILKEYVQRSLKPFHTVIIIIGVIIIVIITIIFFFFEAVLFLVLYFKTN